MLASIAGKLEKGTITQNERRYVRVGVEKQRNHSSVLFSLHLTCMCAVFRFVTKLLEDLVFFVVDIPNSGQDVLEIMVNKPSRERQKLMREQNILKQVGLGMTFTAACCWDVRTNMFHFPSRFSNFSKLRSRTAGTVPCCGWRSWGTSATLRSDTSAGSATECCDIPSRITGRTRRVDAG